MKRLLTILALLFVTAYGAKAQTPIDFNDNLASITDSLYARGQAWGTAFNASYTSGNYSTLRPISNSMLSFINMKITYVQNLKDVKNSRPLRMAMLDLLGFEKRMITEGFRPFEAFNSSTEKATVKAALDNLTLKSKDESTYLAKVGTAQDNYASENGFKIEPAKEEAK